MEYNSWLGGLERKKKGRKSYRFGPKCGWVNDEKFLAKERSEEYYRGFQGHSSQLCTSESHYHESHQTVPLPKSKIAFHDATMW